MFKSYVNKLECFTWEGIIKYQLYDFETELGN